MLEIHFNTWRGGKLLSGGNVYFMHSDNPEYSLIDTTASRTAGRGQLRHMAEREGYPPRRRGTGHAYKYDAGFNGMKIIYVNGGILRENMMRVGMASGTSSS